MHERQPISRQSQVFLRECPFPSSHLTYTGVMSSLDGQIKPRYQVALTIGYPYKIQWAIIIAPISMDKPKPQPLTK